ncbi:SOS response-associated peptidase [Limimaricola pyoseonensis]|uniref:Abasic site processing protein n=1 Tax=Limimaricola pyoseonensis TaxID=521013 RepID=A0A1G7GD98_9RHOB|nr:SOS response-associated peptidase [Limimaricola pyoseonensis]SDE86061.1 Putative SOS response-associated peptidase YedK [Limimaricola pyoseonensis]
MCGRMAITLPHDAMAQMFEATPANDLPEVPNYNVCPTVQVHSVTSGDGARRLRPMRWGFIPHWYKKPNDGPLLINARSETIAEKPAFRAAVRERRCLIPASGFYEWTVDDEGHKLPWYIHREDGDPLAFAGVWQDWERDGEAFTSCAVVTTKAAGRMADIHTRMPVVLEAADWPLWLGEAGHGAAVLMRANPDVLGFHRVDPAVNSNRARGPELIAPIDA